MNGNTKKKLDHQKAFLEAYQDCYFVGKACKKAGISHCLIYQWKENDPDFLKAFNKCEEAVSDWLEDEAKRRAVEGVERTVYGKQGELYTNIEYSDGLMGLLLKGHKPDKYKDRTKTELSGPNDGPIDIRQYSNEDLLKIINGEK